MIKYLQRCVFLLVLVYQNGNGRILISFGLNMRDFDVQFGAKSQGWMNVQVVAGDRQWNADVSDVPCDSIRSLVSSLSMLVQGARECTVD